MRYVYRGTLWALILTGVLHQAVWPQRNASAEESGKLDKLAPAVRQAISKKERQSFIVQFASNLTDTDLSALRQAGARIDRRFQNLPMAVVTASGTTVLRISDLPRVTHISPNEDVESSAQTAGRSPEAGMKGAAGDHAVRMGWSVKSTRVINAQAVWSDGSGMAAQVRGSGANHDEQ